MNPGKVESVAGYSVKQITFFASFILVFYLIVSACPLARAQWTTSCDCSSEGGALVARALDDRPKRAPATTSSTISHESFRSCAKRGHSVGRPGRAGRSRLRIRPAPRSLSAPHSDLLVPLGILSHFAQLTRQKRWWVAVVLADLVGSLATYSRTSDPDARRDLVGIYIWLRPVQMRRLWPALIPALPRAPRDVVPGTIGTLKELVLPGRWTRRAAAGRPGTAGGGRLARPRSRSPRMVGPSDLCLGRGFRNPAS